jgi:hypothetical protein
MCHYFIEGKCTAKMGECEFAHSREELRSTQDLFKTKLCLFWRIGSCQGGPQCRYAHGEQELRPMPAPMPGDSESLGECGVCIPFASSEKNFKGAAAPQLGFEGAIVDPRVGSHRGESQSHQGYSFKLGEPQSQQGLQKIHAPKQQEKHRGLSSKIGKANVGTHFYQQGKHSGWQTDFANRPQQAQPERRLKPEFLHHQGLNTLEAEQYPFQVYNKASAAEPVLTSYDETAHGDPILENLLAQLSDVYVDLVRTENRRS